MSKRSRKQPADRLRARRRARQRDARPPSTPGPRSDAGPLSSVTAATALEAAALACARDDPDTADARARELCGDGSRHDPRTVDAAAGQLLRTHLSRVWTQGWLPVDVHESVRRQAPKVPPSLVSTALADEFAQYPVATTHPRWLDQLAELGAERWWDHARPYLGEWADRDGIARRAALDAVIHLLAVLFALPPLPALLPPPGQATATRARHREGHGEAAGSATHGVDEKMLVRVRALLAKAESTSFPEEAEALSAKAQELMSRYAIERAMLDVEERPAPEADARRIWLDSPYLGAKSLLVARVAEANRCRTVSYESLGFVTVLGDELDLDIVELLTTSLMVQATRAMLAEGRQVTRGGQSRTRSFRQAFLISYATRIGERLGETSASSYAEAGAELVPVLAEREKAVDDLFTSMFPRIRQRSFSVGNAAGWGAGRAAADRATLDAERREIS